MLADEAERIGLVTAVLPPEELAAHTLHYARELAATVSPRSLRETRRQVYTDLHRDVGSAVEESDELIREMMREPAFAGRDLARAVLRVATRNDSAAARPFL